MVGSVTNFSRSGLSDWLLQRISAIILLAYLITVFYLLCTHAGSSYIEWKSLFNQNSFRLFSFFALISLLAHSWIGLWTVFTDYIKPMFLRLLCIIGLVLLLVSYLIWGLMILWG